MKLKELNAAMSAYPGATPPGLKVWAQRGGRTLCNLSWGKTWPYYDLASLTKIFFTTNAFMRAHQEHRLSLSRPLSDFLPVTSKVSLESLLNHTSGLAGWAPFYKRADLSEPVPWRWEELKERVFKTLPAQAEGKKAVYSDINFIFLGWVLEEFYAEPLLQIFQSLQREKWASQDLHFNPLSEKRLHPKSCYAPTERCPWREKTLQGEVHDDNTWALGGVAPHAGLFGSLKGVQEMATMWRQVLRQKDAPWPLKASTLKKFTRRRGAGDFGLGFMVPTPGKSSSGKYFSLNSFGHTGFTGTSVWIDPDQDQMAIVLSNRVHPSRELVDFRPFRPYLHDAVFNKVTPRRT